MEEITLSVSQRLAYEDILQGKSGLLTGTAGTGKTLLIKHVIHALQAKHLNVVHTATTGIAAVLNNGITLHSYLRIFPDDFSNPKGVDAVLERLRKNVASWKRACQDKQSHACLIIDECSMLDIQTFEWADRLLREMRNDGRPFGGLQLILVGDFFQLPPVSKNGIVQYLFESKLFWMAMRVKWELKEVHRQADPVFCALLNRMRFAENTEEDLRLLQSRVGATLDCSKIQPTRLFARNLNVDKINQEKLEKLEGSSVSIEAQHGFHERRSVKKKSSSSGATFVEAESADKKATDKLFKDLHLTPTLELKEGAQVMLCFNLDTDAGLANGTRGYVTGFKTSKVAAESDMFHKQYTEKELAAGQGRVLYPKDVLLPVVEFYNGVKILMPMVRWRRMTAQGEAYVWHVPLRLAWAATMHRVQGQTISHLDVSLDMSVFEVGQAFVAISRAQSLEGLTLSKFDPACIKADERVKRFYTLPFEFQRSQALLEELFQNKLECKVSKSPSSSSSISTSSGDSASNKKRRILPDMSEFTIVDEQ